MNSPEITVFVCANSGRSGQMSGALGRTRPVVPNFGWPADVEQVIVPCAGRLQPEHIMKAFESGASIVSVVACQDDNCHYLEGSRRCARRIEHLRTLLDEVGLGGERLLLFSLPGTASEDMALAEGRPIPAVDASVFDGLVSEIVSRTLEARRSSQASPLALTASHGEPA